MHQKRWTAWMGLGVVVSLGLTACGGMGAASTNTPADPMTVLIEAAQAEGKLNVMALPHDWCNYGAVIETFKTKYNLEVFERDPGAGSADEIAAIKAGGEDAPDAVDVGFGYGIQIVQERLTTPYQVSTWESIPTAAKDASGYWYGDYYGVLAFEVNKNFVKNVPQDWADLLKPEYANQIALAGNPTASNQAQLTVYAAALANGGSYDNVTPGLEFFKQLAEQGNLVPVIGNSETFKNGTTPIMIRWDYLGLSDQIALANEAEVAVVIPKSGVIAGLYIQGINANAPHPNAAKLWMEFLYSDEGQLLWLQGGCHPSRYQDLVARDVIPAEVAARLPPAEAYANAIFPTLDQLSLATAGVKDGWPEIVQVEVVAAEP